MSRESQPQEGQGGACAKDEGLIVRSCTHQSVGWLPNHFLSQQKAISQPLIPSAAKSKVRPKEDIVKPFILSRPSLAGPFFCKQICCKTRALPTKAMKSDKRALARHQPRQFTRAKNLQEQRWPGSWVEVPLMKQDRTLQEWICYYPPKQPIPKSPCRPMFIFLSLSGLYVSPFYPKHLPA